MCGIVGVFGVGDIKTHKKEKLRQDIMRFLATELLRKTEERGKDAAGIGVIFENGNRMIQKSGQAAGKFLETAGGTEKDYEGFMHLWRSYKVPAKIIIGHCRKSSIGGSLSASDNMNNHPIRVGETFGVHNGTLKNHDLIIKNLGQRRDGTVDSEAIIRLLSAYTNNGKDPLTPEVVVEVARRLNGSFSVLAASSNNPFQVAAFRNSERPMEAYLLNEPKVLLVGSTAGLIRETLDAYNIMAKLYKTDWPKQVFTYSDIKTVPINSCAVINLTKEVSDKTGPLDLFERTDLKKADLIWQETTPKISYTNQSNRAVNSRPATSGRNSNTQTCNNIKNSDKEQQSKGLVCNKDLSAYKAPSEKDVEALNAVGMIELPVSTEDTTADTGSSDSASENAAGLRLSSTSVCPSIRAADKAKIVELPAEAGGHGNNEVSKIDMTVDPDAIAAANNTAGKLEKYSDDGDVLVDLEIKNEQNLRDLPVYALCNRLKYRVFKKGFVAGYIAAKDKVVDSTNGKSSKAASTIRVLKHIVKMLARVIDELAAQSPVEFRYRKARIIRRIANRYEKEGDLDSKSMGDVFSPGDYRDVETLEKVVKIFRKEY